MAGARKPAGSLAGGVAIRQRTGGVAMDCVATGGIVSGGSAAGGIALGGSAAGGYSSPP